mmetsp:Transcript_17369/g.44114  ORF Transcript_17369/g.44114 Transcript_17369/m.44114 type:complete len:189 (-) Transcript_17369:134-700(-)
MASTSAPLIRQQRSKGPLTWIACLSVIAGLLIVFSSNAFVPSSATLGRSWGTLGRRPSFLRRHAASNDVSESPLTDEQRAAVLRLPERDSSRGQDVAALPLAVGDEMGGETQDEITDAQRQALRLPGDEAAAERLKQWNDKETMRELIDVDGNPEKMDPVTGTIYKICSAGVMWLWITNIMAVVGHHA